MSTLQLTRSIEDRPLQAVSSRSEGPPSGGPPKVSAFSASIVTPTFVKLTWSVSASHAEEQSIEAFELQIKTEAATTGDKHDEDGNSNPLLVFLPGNLRWYVLGPLHSTVRLRLSVNDSSTLHGSNVTTSQKDLAQKVKVELPRKYR